MRRKPFHHGDTENTERVHQEESQLGHYRSCRSVSNSKVKLWKVVDASFVMEVNCFPLFVDSVNLVGVKGRHSASYVTEPAGGFSCGGAIKEVIVLGVYYASACCDRRKLTYVCGPGTAKGGGVLGGRFRRTRLVTTIRI